MSAKALAMLGNINDYPDEVSDLVEKLIVLKWDNESKNPANWKLSKWVNDRLTALAALPYLSPHIAEDVLRDTRQSMKKILPEFC
jgi:hypothetical protein